MRPLILFAAAVLVSLSTAACQSSQMNGSGGTGYGGSSGPDNTYDSGDYPKANQGDNSAVPSHNDLNGSMPDNNGNQ